MLENVAVAFYFRIINKQLLYIVHMMVTETSVQIFTLYQYTIWIARYTQIKI